jgi:Flagellar hook-length control protein FliK
MKPVAPITRRDLEDGIADEDRLLCEETDEDRARRLADLVLPELFAAVLPRARPDTAFRMASTLVPSKRYEATQAAEGWRSAVGELTASTFGQRAAAASSGTTWGTRAAIGVEGKLVTQLEAGDLGRIRLTIERTDQGLKVSLGVENAVLAALAMSQRSMLEQSLRASGLQVAAVLVTHSGEGGTVLAQTPVAHRPGAIDVTDEGSPAEGTPRGRAGRSNKRLNVTG